MSHLVYAGIDSTNKINIDALLKEGYEKLNSNSNGEAIILFDQVIKLDANKADAYNGRGRARAKLANYDSAIDDFNEAIKLDPKYFKSYLWRGITYNKLNNKGRALSDIDKAIELNNNFSDAFAARGDIYRELKDYEKAIADYDKAIELDSSKSYNYFNRGFCQQALKRYANAIIDYTQTIASKPNDSNAFYNRALCLTNIQSHQMALEDLSKAITIKADEPRYYFQRGYVHYSRGNYEKSIADFENTIKLTPNDAGSHMLCSVAYSRLKNYKKSIEYMNKTIDFDKNEPIPYNIRGWINVGNKESKLAIDDFLLAADLANKNKDKSSIAFSYMSLAVMHHQARQHVHAESYYRTACELEPIYRKEYHQWYKEAVSSGNIKLGMYLNLTKVFLDSNNAAETNAVYAKNIKSYYTASNVTNSTNRQFPYDHLDKLVPDWENINKNSNFLRWLSEKDPVSGRTRREILAEAYKSNDVYKVSQVFNNYKKELSTARNYK
jgi:tetratricopeptide (TPR) repeat protein